MLGDHIRKIDFSKLRGYWDSDGITPWRQLEKVEDQCSNITFDELKVGVTVCFPLGQPSPHPHPASGEEDNGLTFSLAISAPTHISITYIDVSCSVKMPDLFLPLQVYLYSLR